MKKVLACILICSLFACKAKKVSLAGDEAVTAKDFVAAFSPMVLPATIADTNVAKMADDSTTIAMSIFTQFIPDSSVKKITGSEKNVIIHPVGKIEKQKELYLLCTFTKNRRTTLAVFVFDKKNVFLGAKQLLQNINNDEYAHFISVNREPTFLISREKSNAEHELQFTRSGWVYNNAAGFMVVINDGNEDPKKTALINPLDTFPHKNKYSGNYVQDKKNYISLRDGKDASTYRFFIHFEKSDGNCTGELKGDLRMTAADKAVFTGSGDPCVIDFSFTGNEITVKEKGSCGNHRGLQCLFDDTYIRKKKKI